MLPSHASANACLTGWPNAQPRASLTDVCSVVVARPPFIIREVCIRTKGGNGIGQCRDLVP